MSRSWLLLGICVGLACACDFEIRIEFLGPLPKDFVVQIQEPTGTLSPEMTFTTVGQKANYRIRGTCFNRTYLRVYRRNHLGAKAGRIFETSGVMTGIGYAEYKLLSTGLLFMHNAVGVPCAFGTWGTCVKKRFAHPLDNYDPNELEAL